MTENRFVYSFQEGNSKDRMLLGGKGANLCEMAQMGLNVPAGFVITTEACLAYLSEHRLPSGLMEQVKSQVKSLERETGKSLGGSSAPLLVAVRSGSAMSMPGMMDTILNLGLNETSIPALIEQTGNRRFAYDSYRRFIQLFGKIALGVPDQLFDEEMARVKKVHGAAQDVDLDAEALQELARSFLAIVQAHTGREFPADPLEQLEIAIQAVFRSWMGKRAVDYRSQFKITPQMANGTAVSVCAMVFGNMGSDSATGVGFTRNPGTGENVIFGEYLVNAQGEDVVAGTRTPRPIADLAEEMPDSFAQLLELRDRLEGHYGEVQDFEFTIENGRLYCLQTRNGKMNAQAMVRTSVEMFRGGLISREQALLRIDSESLEQLLVPQLAPDHGQYPIAKGLAASPGASSGGVVFDADTAQRDGQLGKRIILVREETRPEDIHGFFAAQGILTSRGGKTSHAAVVARGMGKPCVSGCESIEVDAAQRLANIGSLVLREGDVITIDGSTGAVYSGELPTTEAEFFPELVELLQWADEEASLQVMANADTPADAARAREYGAIGIGLCRTERMFNDVDRLPVVQAMILADSVEERQAAIDRLLPMQRNDFKQIFRTMEALPVTVRLLDPPLHEFLPQEQEVEQEIERLKVLKETIEKLGMLPATLDLIDPEHKGDVGGKIASLYDSLVNLERSHLVDDHIEKMKAELRRVRSLAEVNPMLGHRGVRLGLTFPEIYRMQIRAILEAAAECVVEGLDIRPQVMVPQVCTAEELGRVHGWIIELQDEVEREYKVSIPLKCGSMIETVRACMRASRLAEVAEFFSFGTNDLTQATFSFSREDAESKFLPLYNETGILRDNPFEVLDVQGVGRLIELTVTWGRATRPDLEIGICGEQAGHPESIRFCHYAGLNYVSCSGPRVPVARLAAAQAKLREREYKPF